MSVQLGLRHEENEKDSASLKTDARAMLVIIQFTINYRTIHLRGKYKKYKKKIKHTKLRGLSPRAKYIDRPSRNPRIRP
jgi:hypothetical protein